MLKSRATNWSTESWRSYDLIFSIGKHELVGVKESMRVCMLNKVFWIVSNHQHQLKSLFQHQIVNKAFWILSLGFSYSRNTTCRVDTQQTNQDPLLLAPPLPVIALVPISSCPIVSLSPKFANEFLHIFLFFSANKNEWIPHFCCVESTKSTHCLVGVLQPRRRVINVSTASTGPR